jgi:hypothetical protein
MELIITGNTAPGRGDRVSDCTREISDQTRRGCWWHWGRIDVRTFSRGGGEEILVSSMVSLFSLACSLTHLPGRTTLLLLLDLHLHCEGVLRHRLTPPALLP